MTKHLSISYPSYVITDILAHGGKELSRDIHQIEYFDFRDSDAQYFSLPKHAPHMLETILKGSAKCARKNKNLDELGYVLQLEDVNDQCVISLVDTKNTQNMIEQTFNKKDWATVEEVLLLAGMEAVGRREYQTLTYSYAPCTATYTLTIVDDDDALLTVKAPNEEKMIGALTIIGYSMADVEEID
ncbi:hypothetical protein KC726_04320 [Candidatus Woesebacteria bacterium]|nr:hypothetical protein [Candidatus Woesebacteria bacterium]